MNLLNGGHTGLSAAMLSTWLRGSLAAATTTASNQLPFHLGENYSGVRLASICPFQSNRFALM